jgi:hypothetical protein
VTPRTRGYVTGERFADRAAARARMIEIGARFQRLYEAGAITGYHAVVLGEDDDFLDHDVDRAWIDAELPLVYVEVGYDLERHSAAGHQAVVDELGLRLAVSDPRGE